MASRFRRHGGRYRRRVLRPFGFRVLAACIRVKVDGREPEWASERRIEERALNASGAFQSLVYDGWLLGYRPGPTKRLRCVNPFYPSTLPLEKKVLHCISFYAAAELAESPHSNEPVTIIDPPAWEPLVAELLDIAPDALPRFIERATGYPLPHAGALIRRDGEVVACGVLKLEDDHAGLFALKTAAAWRGRGLGRAVVAALLGEARRRGAATAYLQVTADNGPALALYRRFGFITAYEYWYRARDGEQH
ncbi:MAG: GNAT family N-acetyltransferase [Betaproteobacteria bacterium]|nr:MAG: GNAT family N-acetyltransferase [Betaproteobacteria bacterium]